MKSKYCEINRWFIDELPCYKHAKHTMIAGSCNEDGPDRIKLRICSYHLDFMRNVISYGNDQGTVSTSKNIQFLSIKTKQYGVVNTQIKFRENRL